MKIKSFRGTNVHGYIPIDVQFDDDLAFLTGINGSGKTTIIYSIVSLISPSLYILANIQFSQLRLVIGHEENTIVIGADRNEATIALTTSNTDQSFVSPIFDPDPDEPVYRGGDKEADFYKDVMVSNSQHVVVQAINRLPTPMFLDWIDVPDRLSTALLRAFTHRDI